VPIITDGQITEIARDIIRTAIEREIEDDLGLLEQMEDYTDGLTDTELAKVAVRLANEIRNQAAYADGSLVLPPSDADDADSVHERASMRREGTADVDGEA
jgi:ABC-type Na+ efflux pump permease subunit